MITEGCHAGVAKVFAEKAAKRNKGELNKLTILGVVHWGTLREHELLVNTIPEKMVSRRISNLMSERISVSEQT